MRQIDFRLYLITDRHLLPPEKFMSRIEELLEAGVRAIQIREKDLSTRELLKFSNEIISLAKKYSANIFINDRADVAHAAKAEGLHLPEHSFPASEARKIIGDRLIGKSAHSLEAALRAENEGANFITVGPIYETHSKIKYGAPLGINNLKEIIKEISIPIFAVGGINPDRAKECLDAGAHGVASISSLLLSDLGWDKI